MTATATTDAPKATTPKAETNTKPEKSKGNKKGKPMTTQTEDANTGQSFALSADEFSALPEKMQKRILRHRQEQEARQIGQSIYASFVKRLIEMGYIESGEEAEKIAHISVDSDGNIKMSKKRPKRTISPSSEDDSDEDDDEDEDYDYAQVLVNALIEYAEGEDVTQSRIARLLRPRGRAKGKQPSQATVSNWLNGKSLPNARYHKRIERLVGDYLTDDDGDDDGEE